jgi:DNA-binding NarL/FixJ family response regulator
MAISRGRELASQLKPDPTEVKKSIAALKKDASHVQKCMSAGLREYSSGQAVIEEISDLIQQLEQILRCMN